MPALTTNKEYLEFLEKCENWANSNSTEIYSNDGAPQANAVMSTIFKKSQEQIRIFANNVDGTISQCCECDDTFMKSLGEFISRPNTNLKVVIQTKPDHPAKFFNFLVHKSKEENSRVELKIASSAFLNNILSKRPPGEKSVRGNEYIHFATGDSHMFRIEYDSVLHNAKFSFKNETFTKLLIDDFDSFLSSCEKVS
ncbi:MAG TPA: hypothetical protein VJY62_19545 [Bacteroidia bacterium]|nr:hypothetical protein [Bacteroidia bacterium]